jgi:predicted DNA-binding transcriptional regulator AlpA
MREVLLARTGLSRMYIWRLEEAGRFPQRVLLGGEQ